ncbi:MAG: hypothetical protein AB4911_16390, partial [Oscillochloridaceae bacterium umkhey_bin13]
MIAEPPPHSLRATINHPTPPNDHFHFHPRASNPELWRPSLPLIVRLRTDNHKGLVATWMAIHWLIVLYASSGRTAFGMREIAAHASVGRNELAGKQGYIQRLVELGLIQIVGYQEFPGLREARPIYHIDLAELERLSIESIPELLRRYDLPPPPRPAPNPQQLSLFDGEHRTPQPDPGPLNGPDRVAPATTLPTNAPARLAPHTPTPPNGTAMPTNGTATVAPTLPERDSEPSGYPVSGTDPRAQPLPMPANGAAGLAPYPVMPTNGTATVAPTLPERDSEPSGYPVSGTDPRAQPLPMPANGT